MPFQVLASLMSSQTARSDPMTVKICCISKDADGKFVPVFQIYPDLRTRRWVTIIFDRKTGEKRKVFFENHHIFQRLPHDQIRRFLLSKFGSAWYRVFVIRGGRGSGSSTIFCGEVYRSGKELIRQMCELDDGSDSEPYDDDNEEISEG